jgi:hypothetical protein
LRICSLGRMSHGDWSAQWHEEEWTKGRNE